MHALVIQPLARSRTAYASLDGFSPSPELRRIYTHDARGTPNDGEPRVGPNGYYEHFVADTWRESLTLRRNLKWV